MSKSTVTDKARRCAAWVVVYDSEACTREEDDPAQAVVYYRPRTTPTTVRTSLAGQLAGVVHFCRHAFSAPQVVRTRHSHVALKDYGRFVVMVSGRGLEWARARLGEVTRVLDASTGGLSHLYLTCGRDQNLFTQRLTRVMDALLPQALPDADFRDDGSPEAPASPNSPSTPSQATEASEGGMEQGREGDEEEESLAMLHRVFETAPSVQLPKSGGLVFLRAQQVVEACQQQPGVLAGATAHRNRMLSSQLNTELSHIIATLPLHQKEVLECRGVDYRLPSGVELYNLHVNKHTHQALRADMPKFSGRRSDRGGLHGEATSMDLSSLRSVLHSRQSLHSYPSTLPPSSLEYSNDERYANERYAASPNESQLRRLQQRGPSLVARISGCSELADPRPSQSLPGSPRKIRVAATLPDVGSNSPDLRYKVLTGRKPRPAVSTHSTPRRMPGGRMGNGTTKRCQGLAPPSLRSSSDKRVVNNKLANGSTDGSHLKNGNVSTCYDSEKSESGYEDGTQSDSEINIKNTKNKLNLQFAPDKINRPSHELEIERLSNNDEAKITREINGNLKDSDSSAKDSPTDNLAVHSQVLDLRDESADNSRSEESDISVLDLNAYIDSKENGDRQLAEAVRGLMELTSQPDPPQHTLENHLTEQGDSEDEGSAESDVLVLYTQRVSESMLHLLLSRKASRDPQLIYTLWRLGLAGLEDMEGMVERALELAQTGDAGDAFLQWSHGVISAVSPLALDGKLVATAHRNFAAHATLMEVTLRSDEAVVWGHRHSHTETFYQVVAAPRPGLPIPSDVMAKVPHRARRRLDRDHNITLL